MASKTFYTPKHYTPSKSYNRILSVLDPSIDAALEADARAALEARAVALEQEAVRVGPRDPRYATLRRQANIARGAMAKVGGS